MYVLACKIVGYSLKVKVEHIVVSQDSVMSYFFIYQTVHTFLCGLLSSVFVGRGALGSMTRI